MTWIVDQRTKIWTLRTPLFHSPHPYFQCGQHILASLCARVDVPAANWQTQDLLNRSLSAQTTKPRRRNIGRGHLAWGGTQSKMFPICHYYNQELYRITGIKLSKVAHISRLKCAIFTPKCKKYWETQASLMPRKICPKIFNRFLATGLCWGTLVSQTSGAFAPRTCHLFRG